MVLTTSYVSVSQLPTTQLILALSAVMTMMILQSTIIVWEVFVRDRMHV